MIVPREIRRAAWRSRICIARGIGPELLARKEWEKHTSSSEAPQSTMNRRNTPRGQMSMGKGGPAIQMMEGREFTFGRRWISCLGFTNLLGTLGRLFVVSEGCGQDPSLHSASSTYSASFVSIVFLTRVIAPNRG